MSQSLQSAFNAVKKLAIDFQANESAYLKSEYSEAQVRQDFIDKFFTALGWDVTHELQKNPYEQEVKIENRVSVQGSQRRADYAFFLAPNFKDVRFLVEAKKPSRNIKNKDDYFQTLRYAWNRSTPIAVLTDFKEFHILDCRFKPNIAYALDGEIKSFHYSDYLNEEKFAEIYYLFSREAVANESLEKFADSLPKPKRKGQKSLFKGGFQKVDEAFLESLDGYRELLAKNFKTKNPDLDGESLTEAVQRTLDRLIFIRFLEDKQIEEPTVKHFADKGNSWKAFRSLCRTLAPKYNGLVFKVHPILDNEAFLPPDETVFNKICDELSDSTSPYDFAEIPIAILGSIYERFLGKVVAVSEKRAKVIEKPEVRKAGGVYYTPQYIVRYIVSETVGKLIEGKSPDEISKMAFADIACGSGSFLIEVYEQLLDYHERYYAQHPNKIKNGDTETRNGETKLSLKKRREILLNNIYGCDIDYQATEVTQLSLYLKLLEDATTGDAHQFALLKEKILPDLKDNIICGNSLISDLSLFDEQDKKFNPVDFKNLTGKKGFDAIVGNPPYGAELSEQERNLLDNLYKLGNTDTAALFMKQAVNLTTDKGMVGFIIPKPFLYASNWKKTRSELLPGLREIIDCGKVWRTVKLEQVIYLYEKHMRETKYCLGIREETDLKKIGNVDKKLAEEFDFILNGVADAEIAIAQKMKASKHSLNDVVMNQRGCMLQKYVGDSGELFVLGGKQIGRYELATKVKGKIKKSLVDDEKAYIKPNSILVQRIVAHVSKPKPHILIIGMLSERINPKNYIILDTINQLENKSEYSSKFILAIVNSTLISWFAYRFIFANAIRTMQFDNPTTEKIPFPNLDLSKPPEKAMHDRVVKLVEQIISAKEQLARATSEQEQLRLERQVNGLDRQIDEAVYELYGLTESDIALIEG